jgi:hypothetical protein
MTSRADVYAAIDSERDYQDMRVKRDQGAGFHSTEEFLLYMDDYLTEAKHVASRTWGPDAKFAILEVVRKVVALGVVMMEQHGAPQRAKFERDPEYKIIHLANMNVAAESYAVKLIVALDALRGLPEKSLGQARNETRHGIAMSDVREDIIATLEYHVNRLGKETARDRGAYRQAQATVEGSRIATPEERAQIAGKVDRHSFADDHGPGNGDKPSDT